MDAKEIAQEVSICRKRKLSPERDGGRREQGQLTDQVMFLLKRCPFFEDENQLLSGTGEEGTQDNLVAKVVIVMHRCAFFKDENQLLTGTASEPRDTREAKMMIRMQRCPVFEFGCGSSARRVGLSDTLQIRTESGRLRICSESEAHTFL